MKRKSSLLLPLAFFFFTNLSAQEIVPMHNDKGEFGYGIKGEKNFTIKPKWDEAKPFNSQGIAIVRKGTKFGLIDKSGKAVGPDLGYSLIVPYDNSDLLLVAQGGKITADASKVPSRKNICLIGFKGSTSYPVAGAKWGLVKNDGQFQIKPQYDELSNKMEHGLIAVEKGGKFGFVDINGNEVFQPVYDIITPFNNQGLACLHNRKTKKWCLVKTDGKVIKEDPNIAFSLFLNDHWGTRNMFTNDSIIKNPQLCEEYGCLMPFMTNAQSWNNSDHPYILHPQFQKEMTQSQILSAAMKKETIPIYYEIFDLEGNEVVSSANKFDNVYYSPSEGIAVCSRGEQWGFYNLEDKTFTPVEKRSYLPFRDGCALSYDNGEAKNFYIVDKQGKQVSDTYDAVSLVNDRFVVKKGDRWGVIDHTGKTIIPANCLLVADGNENLFFIRNDVGKVGWVDKDGKTIIPFDYCDGSVFLNGYAVASKEVGDSVSQQVRYGMINRENKTIVPFEFKKTIGAADRNNNLHVWVQKDDNAFYAYDIADSTLTKTAYTDMAYSDYGTIVKDGQGRYGLISYGEEVIPCAVENEKILKGVFAYMTRHQIGKINPIEARSISIRLMPATNKFILSDTISDNYWDF